ncbi:hypothetical protein G7Y89_g10001 [Cudoniella acicularis]|uniref:Uncharacterized protein n=1 Tax=Cudoniella acicularis TaxID=354080 RepID=A0A8H4VZL7_9HELO|nr:hypothetical protein G7Y89_g10001 [Cudoniella acicularis]
MSSYAWSMAATDGSAHGYVCLFLSLREAFGFRYRVEKSVMGSTSLLSHLCLTSTFPSPTSSSSFNIHTPTNTQPNKQTLTTLPTLSSLSTTASSSNATHTHTHNTTTRTQAYFSSREFSHSAYQHTTTASSVQARTLAMRTYIDSFDAAWEAASKRG